MSFAYLPTGVGGYPGPLFSGFGVGLPVPNIPPITPDPEGQYVAGGYGYLLKNIPQILPGIIDDLAWEFGPQVYDSMHVDPYVGSTFRILKKTILASDFEVISAEAASASGSPSGGRQEWSEADKNRSMEIRDFVDRAMKRCDTPIMTVLNEMLDAMRVGNKLAEIVMQIAPEEDQDAGKLLLKDIKVKPRWSWLFVADVFMHVLGVYCFDPTHGGFIVVPIDKFFTLTWEMVDNDPRGTSLYRQAYRAWNIKQLLFPQFFKGLVQFGTPNLVGFTAQDAEATQYPPIQGQDMMGPDGKPADLLTNTGRAWTAQPADKTTKISAQQHMTQVLQCIRNGSAAAFPFGAKVEVHWPNYATSPFQAAFDFLNREMVYGIIGTTRDSMEAQHSSKADSTTAQDKTGNLIKAVRAWIASAFTRQVIKEKLVRMNFGDQAAERFCPVMQPPAVEHHDVVELMRAIAELVKAGMIDLPSQGDALNNLVGLPPAAPGAYARKEEQAQANEEAKIKGKTGEGAGKTAA
jgi:hypothetical protein